MSSTPVQGAAIGDNLTHDGAQAQGKDIQLEPFPDPELALRRLRAFGAALFIVLTLGFCGTGLISSTIVSVRLMWLRTSATQSEVRQRRSFHVPRGFDSVSMRVDSGHLLVTYSQGVGHATVMTILLDQRKGLCRPFHWWTSGAWRKFWPQPKIWSEV